VTPKLSDEAWALLGLLYRARRGRAPQGFREAYKELRANGLVEANTITEKGEATMRDKYANDNKSLPPRGLR
jgi:hypothetical protein